MKAAAKLYIKNSDLNWSANIGMYFNVYPFTDMKFLHLHLVDLDAKSMYFDDYVYKNLSIDDVIDVLAMEAHIVTGQAKSEDPRGAGMQRLWNIVKMKALKQDKTLRSRSAPIATPIFECKITTADYHKDIPMKLSA